MNIIEEYQRQEIQEGIKKNLLRIGYSYEQVDKCILEAGEILQTSQKDISDILLILNDRSINSIKTVLISVILQITDALPEDQRSPFIQSLFTLSTEIASVEKITK